MSKIDIEELRAKVEQKRKAKEKAELLRELRGQDSPVDKSVIYISVAEAARELGVCRMTILNNIRNGFLVARKSSTGGKGTKWVIHPDDFNEFKGKNYARTKD